MITAVNLFNWPIWLNIDWIDLVFVGICGRVAN